MIALSRADGTELWRYTSPGTRNDVNSAPVIAGDLVLASDLAGPSVFASTELLELRWRVPLNPVFVGPARGPAVRAGVAYVGAQGGAYAMRLSDGSTIWTQESSGSLGINEFALCGEGLAGQIFGAVAVRLSDGELLSSILHGGGSTYPTSGFGFLDNRAVLVERVIVYGLVCG